MPGPDESGKSVEETKEEKFLTAEYQALISLDAARNQKLDGFLTLYMTLAAAPWALYALTFKDHGVPTISTIPSLVALAFVLTGILGALVAMMYIQVWFNIVLYMRSVNAIRGYFLEAGTTDVSPADQVQRASLLRERKLYPVRGEWDGAGEFGIHCSRRVQPDTRDREPCLARSRSASALSPVPDCPSAVLPEPSQRTRQPQQRTSPAMAEVGFELAPARLSARTSGAGCDKIKEQ